MDGKKQKRIRMDMPTDAHMSNMDALEFRNRQKRRRKQGYKQKGLKGPSGY